MLILSWALSPSCLTYCVFACFVFVCVPPTLLCSSFLLSFVITCLFGVLCASSVFVCSFSYVSQVCLCFVFFHVCMNLVCLFLQTLCGCVFV